MSRREVDRRAGWTENYLSQILRNAADLKVTHIVTVLEVLRISPEEFFDGLYKVAPVRGPSDQSLVESLAAAMVRYEQRLASIEQELARSESSRQPRKSA